MANFGVFLRLVLLFFFMQSSHEGGVPLEVSVKVSTPVQLDKPMTVACIANMELWDWCIFKMPCAKRAKTFTPATRYDGGRIRMSKRAIEDPKICEVHVDKVKSRDLGDWRCLVKSRSRKYKSTLFNVAETVPEPGQLCMFNSMDCDNLKETYKRMIVPRRPDKRRRKGSRRGKSRRGRN